PRRARDGDGQRFGPAGSRGGGHGMFLQHRRPAARDDTFRAMSGAELGLAVSVFLACAVECVEALTIVLAVGTTRGWPSALGGVGAALAALAAIVAALGTGLGQLPIDALRATIGALLLLFG